MLKRTRERGFTTVELLIVVVILGVLMSLGVPSYREFMANNQVRAKAEGVLNGLQLARAEAIRRNARVFFRVTPASLAWSVGCVTAVGDFDGDGVADCPVEIQRMTAGEGGGTTTLAVLPNGATTVTFTGVGMTTANADGSSRITQLDFDTTTLADAAAKEMRLLISAGGQVRLCEPDITTTGDVRKC